MAINTTAAPSSICPFQLSWRASRVYLDASREATSSLWFQSSLCQRTPTVWLLSWHEGRSLVYLKEKGGNKQKKKKERDLWRTEVKTLKKKRQMEKNQTAPCGSKKPFSDGLVCVDTITERRPEPANTPWPPHAPPSPPQTQTHYFIRPTSSVLIDARLYLVLIS